MFAHTMFYFRRHSMRKTQKEAHSIIGSHDLLLRPSPFNCDVAGHRDGATARRRRRDGDIPKGNDMVRATLGRMVHGFAKTMAPWRLWGGSSHHAPKNGLCLSTGACGTKRIGTLCTPLISQPTFHRLVDPFQSWTRGAIVSGAASRTSQGKTASTEDAKDESGGERFFGTLQQRYFCFFRSRVLFFLQFCFIERKNVSLGRKHFF